MIRPSVLAAWRAFNEPLEGICSWMYLDTEGFVTTGMGNLIDPISLALPLPWRRADGSLADQDEVEAEWNQIKCAKQLAQQGAQAAKAYCLLHLDDAGIDGVIQASLAADVPILMQHAAFADFPNWPADAQLGLLSMAWAMGPGFGYMYPRFSQAVSQHDWNSASLECAMQDNPPPVRRNNATALAFKLAAAPGLDPAVLQSPVPPV